MNVCKLLRLAILLYMSHGDDASCVKKQVNRSDFRAWTDRQTDKQTKINYPRTRLQELS